MELITTLSRLLQDNDSNNTKVTKKCTEVNNDLLQGTQGEIDKIPEFGKSEPFKIILNLAHNESCTIIKKLTLYYVSIFSIKK